MQTELVHTNGGRRKARPLSTLRQEAKTDVQVSVIVVNYNGRPHIGQCLHSLLADRRQDREIILVDNASTDGSADYVEQAFPQVRLIRNERNEGFGQANNLAAGVANGNYLAFLNPDTVVEPNWLDPLIATLEANPQAGLATSQVLLLSDPKVVNTCGSEVHQTGLTLCRGMGEPRDAFPLIEEVDAVSGAAFAMPRYLFWALGGFDPDFFLYMEDTDLSWRAR
nr:glycosyltransferase family 2 protein [Dehalococcoidales bacterium]